MQSVTDGTGEAGVPPAALAREIRTKDRSIPQAPAVDPVIAAQQQAIAAGRAARASREADGDIKSEQRQHALRQAEVERQRFHGRDEMER